MRENQINEGMNLRGMSKEEVLGLYPLDYPRKHLEKHLRPEDRVLFLSGEKSNFEATTILLGMISAFFIGFSLLSVTLLVLSFLFPFDSADPDSIDFFEFFLVSLVMVVSSALTGIIIGLILPYRQSLVVTQRNILKIHRGVVGGGRVIEHDLCAIEGAVVTHEVDEMNYMDFGLDKAERVAEETRSMNVDGMVTFSGFKQRSIAVHNSPELVAILSELADLSPCHTLSSDRKTFGRLLATVSFVVIPFDVLAFLVPFFFPFPMLIFGLVFVGILLNFFFVLIMHSFLTKRNHTLTYCFPSCH
jgi:hypothetical protein